MMTVVLLIVAALLAVMPVAAQPEPVECPLPPYQMPLLPPERSFIDEEGRLFVSGVEEPLDLDGLTPMLTLWSDDGEVLLIAATSRDFESHVFVYRDGELDSALGGETLFGMRTEDFRDAVQLFNPAFVPGTHTILFNTQVLTDVDGIYVEIPQDLWSLDLDTGELRNLIPFDEAGQFSISPDGEVIVLMDFDTIWQTDIDGQNPRTIATAPTIALGLGHGLTYPPVVWDHNAEVPTFRTLLFPTYDPNSGNLAVPYGVNEYALGDEITSRLILSGDSSFFPAVELSPDGYRVAQWEWEDPADAQTMIVSVDAPGAERQIVAEVDVESSGLSPFVRWDDETHLAYGFIDYNDDRSVTAWRADLCGEIVELPE